MMSKCKLDKVQLTHTLQGCISTRAHSAQHVCSEALQSRDGQEGSPLSATVQEGSLRGGFLNEDFSAMAAEEHRETPCCL
jgi:hypothetical protein